MNLAKNIDGSEAENDLFEKAQQNRVTCFLDHF